MYWIIGFIALAAFLAGAFITAKLTHNERVANIAICIAFWLILPFALPFKAKSSGLVSKSIYGWLLAVFSPIGIGLCLIIDLLAAFIISLNKSVSYEELPFTAREEIAAIAEIADFPEFEYVAHSHDGWDGTNFTQNRFKNAAEVEKLFDKLKSKMADPDNVFWTRIPLSDKKDIDFFGCSEIYVCLRGWDVRHSRSPKGITHNAQVKMAIGKKAFTIRETDCLPWNMDFYSSADNLSQLTGVAFPKYEIVNVEYMSGVDPSFEATLKLDKKPSKKFLSTIQQAENWNLEANGNYHFHLSDRKGDLWEDITINPQSRIVKLSVSSH